MACPAAAVEPPQRPRPRVSQTALWNMQLDARNMEDLLELHSNTHWRGPLQRSRPPRASQTRVGLAEAETDSTLWFGTDPNDGTWTWHTDDGVPSSAQSVLYATTRTDDKNSVNPDSESHDFDFSQYDHSHNADRYWNEQVNFDDGDSAPPPWMTMDGNIRDAHGTEIVITPKSSPAAVVVMPELELATSSLLANGVLAAPGVQTRSHERSKKRKRVRRGAARRVSITTEMAALVTHVGESSIHPLMRKLLEIDHPTKGILARAFRFNEVVMLSRLNGLKHEKNGRKLRKVRV
jgi:hypothetical protein